MFLFIPLFVKMSRKNISRTLLCDYTYFLKVNYFSLSVSFRFQSLRVVFLTLWFPLKSAEKYSNFLKMNQIRYTREYAGLRDIVVRR